MRIGTGEAARYGRTVLLELRASDLPSNDEFDEDEPPTDQGAVVSGVAEMIIASDGSFAGATWEPYQHTRLWTLQPDEHGRATVYVKYRDHAGNESLEMGAIVEVLDGSRLLLPVVVTR